MVREKKKAKRTRSTANTGPRSAARFVINFVLIFLFSSYLGYLEHFLEFNYLAIVAQLIEQWTHYLEEMGSNPTPGHIFSIYPSRSEASERSFT